MFTRRRFLPVFCAIDWRISLQGNQKKSAAKEKLTTTVEPIKADAPRLAINPLVTDNIDACVCIHTHTRARADSRNAAGYVSL